MREYAVLVILVISIVMISGCTSSPSGQKDSFHAPQITTPVQTGQMVMVTIKARAFDPSTITIKEGTTVTWVNEDPVIHHVVHLPEVTQKLLFDSGPLSTGQSFSYRFEKKGRYNYADPQIGGGRTSLVIVE
jgi:plastocyanin